MANAREIQTRIKSIQQTMQITNAMYMISSTKMRKAKDALDHTVPYFNALESTVARILRHVPEMRHPYFDERENIPEDEKKRGYLVITADKGLAGAYNHNVIKLAEEYLKQPGDTRLFVVGQLGENYFARKKMAVDTHFRYTAQDPSLNRARNISERLMTRFMRGDLDEVYLIYTRMEDSRTAAPQLERLLPFKRQDFGNIPSGVRMEQLSFMPSPEAVLDIIGPNIMSGLVYCALVESYCSEQSSRVTAMQSATDNAKTMLKDLSVQYNRVRQGAITQEITEVISGAKALKGKK